MKRTRPLVRYTRINPYNAARRAEKFRRNYGARAEAVRDMRCLVGVGCLGPVCAAHAKARGMGGAGGDRRSLVPLCNRHHEQSHTWGKLTFEARYVLDIDNEAARIAGELDALGYE